MQAPSPGQAPTLSVADSYHILYTRPEIVFDDIVALAAQACAAAVATLSFFTDCTEWFKACAGAQLDELPLDPQQLAALAENPAILETPDLRVEPCVAAGAFAKALPGIRSCARAPILTSDGRLLGALSIAHYSPRLLTLTQRQALAALARQAAALVELRPAHCQQVQLDERLSALGVLARGIGHQLRNPLVIISGNAQLAQGHLDNRELVAECMRHIHAGTMRAGLLLDNLLAFTHAHPECDQTAVDMNRLLEAACAQLAHQLVQRSITLSLALSPQLAPVIGCHDALQQAFSNLLLNACQAMATGGTLHVITRMRGARRVEVSVADTGCGIPPEVLPRIFEPFFSARPAAQGVGLGLSVSRSIIRQHGGAIEVHTCHGDGSTFTVSLPVSTAKTPLT